MSWIGPNHGKCADHNKCGIRGPSESKHSGVVNVDNVDKTWANTDSIGDLSDTETSKDIPWIVLHCNTKLQLQEMHSDLHSSLL